LHNPAKNDLSDGFLVFGSDGQQDFILENVVPALGKWRPRFNRNAVILKKFLRINLLLEWVDFNLIYRRHYFVVNHQVHDSVWLKIGDPDCPDLSLLIQLFHRPPFAIHITKRLMDEIQIKIIQLQSFQRPIKGFPRTFIAIALNKKFRRDKQFFSRNAAFSDAVANCFFIHVRSGGVNMAIPSLNGVNHASLTLGWIGNLKNAKSKNRDFNSII